MSPVLIEKQEGERKTTLTFPLISKRLQLYHIQLIARGLCLPTAALAGDLSVMISEDSMRTTMTLLTLE